jgi:hypothetical protein
VDIICFYNMLLFWLNGRRHNEWIANATKKALNRFEAYS